MNKTIASLAILASASSAFAIVGPPRGGVRPPQPTNYCLTVSEDAKGNAYVGSCDETAMNRRLRRRINENGCADGQASLKSLRVVIPACTGFVQL